MIKLGKLNMIVNFLSKILSSRKFRTGNFGLTAARRIVGREVEYKILADYLTPRMKSKHKPSTAVLSGPAGIGKTELARFFACEEAERYHGVLWVDGSSRQGLIDALCSLWRPLGLSPPRRRYEAPAREVVAAIASTRKPWLLILDDVRTYRDMQDLLPENAYFIVTTRNRNAWPEGHILQLGPLSYATLDAPAVRLLIEEAGQFDEPTGACDLAEALDGLPVSLIAMGEMVRCRGGRWADWSQRFEERLSKQPVHPDYPVSTVTLTRLAIEGLSDDAALLADLCAWWAPVDLNPSLITTAVKAEEWKSRALQAMIPGPLAEFAEDHARVEAAFQALAGRGIIAAAPDGAGYSMRDMTAASLRALQIGRSTPTAALALLYLTYPGDVDASANWDACGACTPHVLAQWAAGGIACNEFAYNLLNRTSIYLSRIGDHASQLKLARAVNEIARLIHGEKHMDFSVSLANLGRAHMDAGSFAEGEAWIAEAVTLDERNHPGSASLASKYGMHGCALLAMAQRGERSRLPTAKRRYQSALRLSRQLNGRDSDEVANDLNGLALVRGALHDRAAASRLHRAALRIQRRRLPVGDARLATYILNVGNDMLMNGDPESAEDLLREGLAAREKALAEFPEHDDLRRAARALVVCLLAIAMKGHHRRTHLPEAWALCEKYGLSYLQENEFARQHVIKLVY